MRIWQAMFETNVPGTVRVVRGLLPALRASGDAHIGPVEQAPTDHDRANVAQGRADVLRAGGAHVEARSGSPMVIAASPLPYQFEQRPTPSLSSAMNPSSETVAPKITLP